MIVVVPWYYVDLDLDLDVEVDVAVPVVSVLLIVVLTVSSVSSFHLINRRGTFACLLSCYGYYSCCAFNGEDDWYDSMIRVGSGYCKLGFPLSSASDPREEGSGHFVISERDTVCITVRRYCAGPVPVCCSWCFASQPVRNLVLVFSAQSISIFFLCTTNGLSCCLWVAFIFGTGVLVPNKTQKCKRLKIVSLLSIILIILLYIYI